MSEPGGRDDSADGPTPNRTAYRRVLEGIDRRAARLLAAVRADDALADEVARETSRHLREIRAEVELVRLAFGRPGGDDFPTADVPMLVRRGPTAESVLGPAPGAFERAGPTAEATADSTDDEELDAERVGREDND